MTSEGEVLTLRALGLGDFLTAVPALRALQREMPGRRHLLAQPGVLTPLLPLAGLAMEVVDHAGAHSMHGLERPAEVAVNLHGRGPESHRTLLSTGPRRIIAFARPDLGVDGPEWVEGERETRRWCRLLASAGIEPDEDDIYLDPPPDRPPDGMAGATVIHPGAKDEARRWPASRFAAVARQEADRGRNVIITGTRREAALARTVAARAGLPASTVWAGRTDLRRLASIIAAAGVLLCGDTGVAHLATALRTPSVLLFGPTDPAQWGPPPSPRHLVLWKGHTGDPHGAETNPGLAAIKTTEVLRALGELRDREDAHSAA